MADGRDVNVWDVHADQCREAERSFFEFSDTESTSLGGWLRNKVLTVIIPAGGTRALDVGCGPGYWQLLFRGMTYEGFDQSSRMLKLAEDLEPGNVWKQGNARTLGESYEPQTFDVVFTASVLQHNRHAPDKTEIVKGIHGILKDGGYLLCSENTFREDNRPESVGNPEDTDGYSFTPIGWEKFMKNLGFELLDFNGRSEYLYQKV